MSAQEAAVEQLLAQVATASVRRAEALAFTEAVIAAFGTASTVRESVFAALFDTTDPDHPILRPGTDLESVRLAAGRDRSNPNPPGEG